MPEPPSRQRFEPSTSGRLAGKVALITGGTSGIGSATVNLFAREGARVLFTGRNRQKAENVIAASGDKVTFIEADVRQDDDCRAAVQATLERHGKLDILFNNAGVVILGGIEATSDKDWATVLGTNVTGVFQMCRAAIGALRDGGGTIVNNASDWGLVGGQEALAYAASKGAVVQLTRSLALDLARDGVRVNAVCPGDTYVERWREQSPADVDEEVRDMAAAIPMGRVAEVAEIAEAVLFLASDASSYVTGQCLVVDGGNTAGGASATFTGR
ncbi:MAG: meso-butanediol dehydrogenase / (S,S)-butanediol dehydrogenase / diacetyl reductase [Actinomycetota bacterium]|jgi:NAD(P)-dependent dehydrogenase (short-subunit alcohol dehydrogenase family)|nr:meso-butanediol dehydrogenase / (S,S)-butanediol dehydrogenase / diacetyl reductase [Actinomycetota bacterium]